jgi:hypothetical protein
MLDEHTFSDVINVEPFDIGVRSSSGYAEVFGTPLFAPEHVINNKTAAAFYWLYASSGGIGVTDGQSHFDITPTTPPITSTWPANWTDAQLNQIVCVNNNVDPPWFWDNVPANIMQALPDWPVATTCRSLRAYQNNLIAMDIRGPGGDFINQLMWSDAADPGTIPQSWTPLPENSAGDNVLADTIGTLIDGQAFRDTFLLLKEHSTYLMNFIGGNFVFGFRKLFDTSGILSTNCAAEYLGEVFILTDGDFIRTDGQTAQTLIDKRMRRWLFNNIDSDAYQSSFVVSYHAKNQVWCCFPEAGESEPTLALVWDATDDKFGVRELRPSAAHIARGQVGGLSGVLNWDDDDGEWDLDVTGWNSALFNPTEDALVQANRTQTRLVAVNEGTTYGGEAIHSRVEKTGLDFGDFKRIKLVKTFAPRIIGNPGTELTIRLGSSNNDANIVQWSAPVPYVIGDSQKIDTFAQGRFIAFSIESKRDQATWLLQGVEFEYDLQGYF